MANLNEKFPSIPTAARVGAMLLVGGLCVTSEQLVGCSSAFHSCTETRTCAALSGAGGDAGETGDAAGATNAGAGKGGSNDVPGGHSGAAGDDSAGSAGDDASAGAGSAGAPGLGGAGGATAGIGGATAGSVGTAGSAPIDTLPPVVNSIVPANGAKGVKADTKIVVTFSEAVDKTAAQAALTTSAGAVAFTWNAQGTELTATPSSPLVYATGATATSYTVQVSTGLKDLAGNHSVAAFNSSFSTLRQASLKISREVNNTYTVVSTGEVFASSGDASPAIGDGYDNSGFRSFPDFDISALPASLTTIVSASMSIPITLTSPINSSADWGTPLASLGNLLVDHVFDSPIQATSFSKAALSSVGTLMTSTTPYSGVKTIEVTDAVNDDFANRVARANHSLYRLQFAKLTDNDAALDRVGIPFNQPMTLDIVYLIP